MKVMKFGGTSVGSPSRMKEVTKLVTKSGEPSLCGFVSNVWNNQFTG